MKSIASITRQQFLAARDLPTEPCLVVDGLEQWPACGTWSPEYLKSTCGSRPVIVYSSASGRWRLNPDGTDADPTSHSFPMVPLATAADWVMNAEAIGRKFYVLQSNLRQYPELLEDVRFDRSSPFSTMNLWFGSAGTVTVLHHDDSHNCFAQVVGAKTFTLFAPSDLPWLYPYPDQTEMWHISSVDVEAPDVGRFPLFPRAEPRVVTVEAGQMLFLPAFWWHHVVSNAVSLSVNQWTPLPVEAFRGPNALRQLAREFKRDGWTRFRMSRQLTLERLVAAAESLASAEPAAAVLASAAALRDLERWPGDGDCAPARIDVTADASVARLMTALLRSEEHVVSEADARAAAEHVGTLVAARTRAIAG